MTTGREIEFLEEALKNSSPRPGTVIEWSLNRFCDNGHRAVNLAGFEPVFFLALVFALADDTYNTESYFLPFLQHGKTCAC